MSCVDGVVVVVRFCHFVFMGAQIQDAAAAAGTSPQQFCDGVSASFRALFDDYGISYTDFIRTTEPRHKEVCGV